MSRDGSEGGKRRPRPIVRPSVPPGPLADLKALLYELYVQADCPSLDDIAAAIAADDDLPGAPARDSVNRIIGSPQLPPNQADVVAVVRVLARQARWDEADAAAQARSLWTAAQLAASRAPDRLGKPIAGLNPLALEVHPAITAGPAAPDHDDVLPAYIRRTHDDALDAIVNEVQTGACRLVVLVGDSSTGKTRACWEAVRKLGEPWRLWHPLNPGKPAAAVAELARVGPHTVVWLNETQNYLMTADPVVGEQITAELREILGAPERGPVLVVGTLWRKYWNTLTTPSSSLPDPYAQARELLKGVSISLPETFTGADHEAAVRRASESGDPRLIEALSRAASGHLAQYLAGGPALIDRYDKAEPAAQAIMEVALDARRLGHGSALPRRFLEEAAVGYLTDEQLDLLPDGGLERAFAYLTDPQPCRGARPPLTRMRPRPGNPPGSADVDGGEPCYRLADYLEQYGAEQRRRLCPPTGFWEAAAAYAINRFVLARAAEARCRYRHAAALYQTVPDGGDVGTPVEVQVRFQRIVENQKAAEGLNQEKTWYWHPLSFTEQAQSQEAEGDRAGAEWTAEVAAVRGHPEALEELIWSREVAGDRPGAERLAQVAADRGYPEVLGELAQLREVAGDRASAERLAQVAVDRGYPKALELGRLRKEIRNSATIEWFSELVVARGYPEALEELASTPEAAGGEIGYERLTEMVVGVRCQGMLRYLVRRWEAAGSGMSAERLARAQADAGYSFALRYLAWLREKADGGGRWSDLLRYGLEADGRNSYPW